MPKKGCYDNTYPDKLKNIRIILLEPFHGTNNHHVMRCEICDYIWSSTPKSKIANFKKHGHKGCPKCTDNVRYAEARIKNLNILKERGFEILTEGYNGKRRIDDKKFIKIKVRNKHCGHVFESLPANLLGRDVKCPICNTQRKREAFQEINRLNQVKYQETASAWNVYRHLVYQITRQTYKTYKPIINPNNYIRGRAGVDGAYQLDHIVPVRYCFDNNIPVELCAHQTNLQMLYWDVNLTMKENIKQYLPIPKILQEYIVSN